MEANKQVEKDAIKAASKSLTALIRDHKAGLPVIAMMAARIQEKAEKNPLG